MKSQPLSVPKEVTGFFCLGLCALFTITLELPLSFFSNSLFFSSFAVSPFFFRKPKFSFLFDRSVSLNSHFEVIVVSLFFKTLNFCFSNNDSICTDICSAVLLKNEQQRSNSLCSSHCCESRI